jgi:hypothetical protein
LDVSLGIGATGSHVPYKGLVELRAAYMPDGAWAVSGIPQADLGGRVSLQFCHRLFSFRHFISGLLALASLNRACRNHCPGASATLTTIAFDNGSLRWLEIST